MAADLGASPETGSAPIADDLLDQQEAGPTPSSPAPKASHGGWGGVRVDPRRLSADLGGVFVFCRGARNHGAKQPAGGAGEGRR